MLPYTVIHQALENGCPAEKSQANWAPNLWSIPQQGWWFQNCHCWNYSAILSCYLSNWASTCSSECWMLLMTLNSLHPKPQHSETQRPESSNTQNLKTQRLKPQQLITQSCSCNDVIWVWMQAPRQCSSCLTSAYALPDAPVWEGRGLGLRNQTPKIQKLKTQNLKTQKLKPHKTQNPKAHNSKSIHYRVLYQITGSHSVMILGF